MRCHVAAYRVFGIGRVHHEVDRAGARALVENLVPGPAAIGRLEHAAHLVVGPFVTRGRHVHDVRVGGVDHDARDGLAVGQTHVLPCLPGIGRFVDADAGHRRAEDVGFTGADPHDVRVRRRHCDVADAGGRHVLPDHLPRGAVVVGFPDAAGRVGRVDATASVLVGDRVIGGPPADVGGTRGMTSSRPESARPCAWLCTCRRPSRRNAASARCGVCARVTKAIETSASTAGQTARVHRGCSVI